MEGRIREREVRIKEEEAAKVEVKKEVRKGPRALTFNQMFQQIMH